jgi:hypothetical protein
MNKKTKKIPYGISDFEIMRKANYYYIDKTEFIETIENSSRYLFFIRPRRFGKSLWLSLMECYYDIARKDRFEELFSGTYIYDNPTEERHNYFILKLNFSLVSSDINEVQSSFNETVRLTGMDFVEKYQDYLNDKNGEMYDTIKNLTSASSVLKHIISFIKNNGNI